MSPQADYRRTLEITSKTNFVERRRSLIFLEPSTTYFQVEVANEKVLKLANFSTKTATAQLELAILLDLCIVCRDQRIVVANLCLCGVVDGIIVVVNRHVSIVIGVCRVGFIGSLGGI